MWRRHLDQIRRRRSDYPKSVDWEPKIISFPVPVTKKSCNGQNSEPLVLSGASDNIDSAEKAQEPNVNAERESVIVGIIGGF